MPDRDSSPPALSAEAEYPSCQTTVWQIGQWRCEYWRPEGRWRAGSLRLFRADRLIKTVGFGLHAREQSRAWRTAILERPDASTAAMVNGNDGGVGPLADGAMATRTSKAPK
jgi:hypothetical protein